MSIKEIFVVHCFAESDLPFYITNVIYNLSLEIGILNRILALSHRDNL